MVSLIPLEERQSMVMAYLKANAGRPVSSKELREKVFPEFPLGTVKTWLARQIKLDPSCVETVHAQGYVYHTPAKPLENSEGYSDPTAGKAIEKVEPSLPWKPGEIWIRERFMGSTKEKEFLLIVGAIKERVTYLSLYTVKRSVWTMPVRISLGGETYWTDPTTVSWCSANALERFSQKAEAVEFSFAKKALGKYLGTTEVVEREVVKEVPKIKMVTQPVKVSNPEDKARIKELEEQHDDDCVEISDLKAKITELEAIIDRLNAEADKGLVPVTSVPDVPAEVELAVLRAKVDILTDMLDRTMPRPYRWSRPYPSYTTREEVGSEN